MICPPEDRKEWKAKEMSVLSNAKDASYSPDVPVGLWLRRSTVYLSGTCNCGLRQRSFIAVCGVVETFRNNSTEHLPQQLRKSSSIHALRKSISFANRYGAVLGNPD